MRSTPFLLILALAGGGAFAQQRPDAGRSRGGSLGVTYGTVKAVQAGKRQLTVTLMRGGTGERTVNVPAEAEVFRLGQAKATDLRPGDMLSVVGMPLQIDARQVRIGDVQPGAAPRRLTTPAPAPRPAPPAPPKAAPRPAQPRAAPTPSSAGNPMARVFGRVTRLTPLQVTLPGGINVQVKTGRDTRFTRAVRLTLPQIKVGEPVVVFGPTGADGVVSATRIQVGLEGFPTQRAR